MVVTDRAELAEMLGIQHHFSSGVYAKEMHLAAGTRVLQHSHPYDHLSILAAGTVAVIVDGESRQHTGPATLVIKAGARHEIRAVTDATWFCIHATDETDPQKVDDSILKG